METAVDAFPFTRKTYFLKFLIQRMDGEVVEAVLRAVQKGQRKRAEKVAAMKADAVKLAEENQAALEALKAKAGQ